MARDEDTARRVALIRGIRERNTIVPSVEELRAIVRPEVEREEAVRDDLARALRGLPPHPRTSPEARARLDEEIAAREVVFILDCVAPFLHRLEREQQAIPRPSLGQALRRRIIARDGQRCRYCGRDGDATLGPEGTPWQIDHRWPVSRGGGNEESNLVLACGPCNNRKRAQDPERWPLLPAVGLG